MPDTLSELLVGAKARWAAKEAGHTRYITGEPCRAGHLAERLTSNGSCTACLAATRKKSADKGREATKRWREANIEQARAKGRAWYHANRDRAIATAAAWKDANLEAKRKHAKAWRERNPAKSRQQTKDWREQNPEWSRRNTQRWREENPAKARAADTNNRARRKSVEGRHSESDIQRIVAQQRSACAYCKASVKGGFHVDHIQPISKGGSNWPRNLQILCAKCNLTKNAKDPIDFAQEMGRLL